MASEDTSMSEVVAGESASSVSARPVPSPVGVVRLLPGSGGVPVALAVVLGLLVFPVVASPIE